MKLEKALKKLNKDQTLVFVRKSEYEAAGNDDEVKTVRLTAPGEWTDKEFIDAFREQRDELTEDDWKTREWMEVSKNDKV